MILAVLASLALGAPPEEPSAAAEALASGDAHYARRAEGARGGIADPVHVDRAIADYRRALALAPLSYEARLRLLRAFFFRGGFCDMDPREQVKLFEEAKRLAEDSVRLVDADLHRVRGHLRADAARNNAPAAETYLWAAVSWGQWAVFHKLYAAWQSAPARIRDLAQAVIQMEPAIAQAGGYLILGRLHVEAPRIPMLTGWVSREKGVAHLRAGLAIAPDNTALMYFLADALLSVEPSKKEEARALLQRCASAAPRPEYAVEDAHYAEEARERLAGLR